MEELNARESGKPKSDLLGRLYRVQGQMCEVLGLPAKALTAMENALEVYKNLPGDNTEITTKLEGYISAQKLKPAEEEDEEIFDRKMTIEDYLPRDEEESDDEEEDEIRGKS